MAESGTAYRFKACRIPFHIDIVHILTRHPPLEECEEQTIDNEDRGVDRTYEWTQAHGSGVCQHLGNLTLET